MSPRDLRPSSCAGRRSDPARWAALSLITSSFLAGCGTNRGAPSTGDASEQGCAPWELPLEGGACHPAGLPPDMPCPPGEHLVAEGRCQPAGVPTEGCASGFEPDGDGGCRVVLPAAPCPPGQLALPGETACRDVAPCGGGPYGDIPVDDRTEFVDAAYPGDDSDGTPERPWKTIQRGVVAAARGAVVAVAAGTYAETVSILYKPVLLWGRCPGLVEVTGAEGSQTALEISADGTEVHGLAVAGTAIGVVVEASGRLTLDRVWVHDTTVRALNLEALRDPPSITLRDSLVERCAGIGVLNLGPNLEIERSVVRDVRLDAAGGYGAGVIVQASIESGERGSMVLRGSLVERSHGMGVSVVGADAEIEGTVVRAALPDGSESPGVGIHVRYHQATKERGRLTLRSSLIEQNQSAGIFVGGADATVESTVVRDSRNGPLGGGFGIAVSSDPLSAERGRLTLRSSLIERNEDMGMANIGADAEIESTILRDTRRLRPGQAGFGLGLEPNSAGATPTLVLRSSRVERNQALGVSISGSEATIESTVVRDTRPTSQGFGGRGLNVEDYPSTGQRSSLFLTSSLIERNQEVGIFVGGSDATIESTVVQGTLSDGNGAFGRGINLTYNPLTGERGRMTLRRSRIEDNQNVGVFISQSDATIEASNVSLTRTDNQQDIADGIVAVGRESPSEVHILATAVTSNVRAGVMFIDSVGSMGSSRSADNRFGLVINGDLRPTLGDDNEIQGNTEQNDVTLGSLLVPDDVQAIP